MQVLIAPNESFILSEKTSFNAEEAVAQTVLSCENASGFSVGDYVVLDTIGSELAEIRKISEIASDLSTITMTAATNFKHAKDAPITLIRYNKRKFYRSTSETGTYIHLSSEGSPIDIQVDKPEGTEFEDTTGEISSWYKATYWNETSGEETSVDSAIATKAGDAEEYTSIFKIKSEAGFIENDYITTEIVGRYRDEAQAQIDGTIVMAYSLPFSTIPKLITHISTLLSAGLLLQKEYGVENDSDISKSGKAKIDRAEILLQKIIDNDLLLVNSSGDALTKKTTMKVSGSNAYSSDKVDKGEMFNLNDENFKLTDPTDPTASSDRISTKYQSNPEWSQK